MNVSEIASAKEILEALLRAAHATGNFDPKELSSCADALYAVDAFQWARASVDPKKLLTLMTKFGSFANWTSRDNEISGRYAEITSTAPPVAIHFLKPKSLSIVDGRHRLVAAKYKPEIAIVTPDDEIGDVLRLIDETRSERSLSEIVRRAFERA